MGEEKIRQTIKTYNDYAKEYYNIHNNPEEIKSMLEFFIKNLKGKKILDAGCGPGRDSKYFTQKGFQSVGIDLSEKLLEIAKKRSFPSRIS